MTVQSNTWPTMEMVTHGDLCLHWGEEGIRITRVHGEFTRMTTREAKWLGAMLPVAAAVVDVIQAESGL